MGSQNATGTKELPDDYCSWMPRLRNTRPIVLVTAVLAVAALAAAGFGHGKSGANRLPGAKAYAVCAAAGPFWPTQTLAIVGSTAWIACKERSRVERFDLARGRRLGSVELDAPVIAVTSGFGAGWALDTEATLYRLQPRSLRIVKRIPLGAQAPYNIWIGAGSVWVVDDRTGRLIRVSPPTNRVTARLAVGDGPSDMVFDGTTAWIVNHRDRGLIRLDARTNTVTRLATLPGDAPERIARLGGSLWVTGRGTDLVQVDPSSGDVTAVVETGGSGIDVVAVGAALWVPSRSEAVDRTGFPTMEALRRVTADGSVTTVTRANGRVDVHGLAAGPAAASVWLADNTGGVLYRMPARSG